jgi:DNA replication protein DnaC
MPCRKWIFQTLYVSSGLSYFRVLTVCKSRWGPYVNQLKKKSQKANVLILDDFGISPLEDFQTQDLFEIIEDRHGVGSTIITAQLPTTHWHDYLGGGMLGDGICDRLLHNCHNLNLEGETYRAKAENLTDVRPSKKNKTD